VIRHYDRNTDTFHITPVKHRFVARVKDWPHHHSTATLSYRAGAAACRWQPPMLLISAMQLSTITRITPEQFFAWILGREERYELVDGEVLMMAGAGRRHDRIVVNLTAATHSQIKGGPCQTFTGDTYVVTSSSTRRMPDLGVDCGRPDDDSMTADKPSLIVEVLSPTTGGFDVTVKLAEYQSVPSVDYILFVDTESPNVHLYSRDDDRLWKNVVLKGLEAVVELKKLNVCLDLREIYSGLEFRPKPRLVDPFAETDEPTGRFHPS
jgi:Uma2 family endonuclease